MLKQQKTKVINMAEIILSIDELRDLMNRRKAKKFVNGLIPILIEKKQNDINEFYDLYGELINENFGFALNRCYHLFRSKASSILVAETLAEMDMYILSNFALAEQEKLITSFKGVFKRPKAKLKGHVFLTNFRFLGTGTLSEKGSTPGVGPKSLLAAAVVISRDARRNAIKKALVRAMGDKFSEKALNVFQYHFPIINAYNVKKSSNNVAYTVNLKYQVKKKMKEKIMAFKVTPKIEKTESPQSFAIRKEEILNVIEETLLKAQTSEN